MNKAAILFSFLFCTTATVAKAQVAQLLPTPTGITPPRPTAHTRQILLQEPPPLPMPPQQLSPGTATDFQGRPLLRSVPANHATVNYGFFCRQELKMDRASPLKTRFRLGSQQQADYLDGKR